jgi:hypothetical protein
MMASGYEKSPDYGGSELTLWEAVLIAALVVGIAAAYILIPA